ncbi:MAG: insulinase family protein, partial [Bacteroidaceae bacterium]|nr:insulinase family protein [Bacteroidaceae bacterium]
VIEEARATQYEAFVDEVNNDPFIPVMPKSVKIQSESAAPFGYTCWTLKNGARVFFKQTDFNASEVAFSAVSKGGSSLLPEKDVKNASILGNVMGATGIGTFSSTELEKKLAGKQVSCGAILNQVTERLSGSSTPKDLRTLFELIYLRFQQPCLDQKGYDNLMATLRTSLENAEKEPMLAFSDSVRKVLYGNQPRLFRLMHLSDMEGLDYAEVRRIYSDRFKNGGDFDFFFTGAFDIDSLRLFTEQYIAPLKAQKKRETYVDHHIDFVTGSVENIFNRKMETPQARVMEFWHGTYPHNIPNELAVDALGAILSQRYLKSIREDAGIAYSVGASGDLTYEVRDEYTMQISCPVKPAQMQEALRLMKVDLEDIAANGVKEEELAKVREFKLKTYADSQKKNGYWHSLIVESTLWDKDGQTGYEEAVKTLSSEQIQKFAKHMIQEGNCRIIGILPTDMTE